MYTISIQFTDGSRYTERNDNRSILNIRSIAFGENKSIEQYWVEDEAGNVVDHYSREEAEEDWSDEDDGQPTEYEEWQDYMGGDDWDHGQYDTEY